MAMEIERKFLVDWNPTLDFVWDKVCHIRQIYLAVDGNTEMRIRTKRILEENGKKFSVEQARATDKFYLTIKVGEGLRRAEVEKEISEQEYYELATFGPQDRVIFKTRFNLGEIEVDQYHGHLEGLVVAEVEFDSTEAANTFAAPEWFGREVTEDKRYKNKYLALNGKPQD